MKILPSGILLTVAAVLACTPACANSSGSSIQDDARLSCAALAQEIDAMEIVMGRADHVRDRAQMTSRGTGIATAAISAVSALTGGAALGLFGAGAAAEYATDEMKEDAVENAHNAELRRIGLIGLYTGKGCDNFSPPPADIEPAAGDARTEPRQSPAPVELRSSPEKSEIGAKKEGYNP